MPTQRATKGARTPGTWLTTLDSNEGTGMNSRVPATLVSRTAEGHLSGCCFSPGAGHTGSNEYSSNKSRNRSKGHRSYFLKNAQLEAPFQKHISLRAMWLWENHGAFVGSGPIAPLEPSSVILYLSFTEIRTDTKRTPLINEIVLEQTVHNRVHLGGVPTVSSYWCHSEAQLPPVPIYRHNSYLDILQTP